MTDVRAAILRADVEAVAKALADDVVWVGARPRQLCRNREQVVDRFRQVRAAEKVAHPEIVAELEDMFVVDPHLEPPAELNPTLHQVYVVEDGRIVELRDYPDRNAALEAVGLR